MHWAVDWVGGEWLRSSGLNEVVRNAEPHLGQVGAGGRSALTGRLASLPLHSAPHRPVVSPQGDKLFLTHQGHLYKNSEKYMSHQADPYPLVIIGLRCLLSYLFILWNPTVKITRKKKNLLYLPQPFVYFIFPAQGERKTSFLWQHK